VWTATDISATRTEVERLIWLFFSDIWTYDRKTFFVAAMFLLSVSTGAALANEMRVGGTGAAHGILLLLGEAFKAAHPRDNVEVVSGMDSSGGISAVAEEVYSPEWRCPLVSPDGSSAVM